jgi:hypothetical protein
MSEIKRKRNSYSLDKKLKIIRDVENEVEYDVIVKTKRLKTKLDVRNI